MAKPKTKPKSKAVVKTQNNGAMFSEDRPDHVQDTSRGQEGVGLDDITIPRLEIVQSLSPQRKKNDPAYIEGAEEGMLFNTVSNILYGDNVIFVPCFFRKEWIIWKKQNAGGGFNGSFSSEEEALAEFDEKGYEDETFKDDGNKVCAFEIVDTAQHFGFIVGDKSTNNGPVVEEVVISMAKSKMKPSRQLNTMVKMSGGDRFSKAYRISAALATNKNNQEYYTYTINALGYVGEALYQLGEKMYDAISSGAKDVKDVKDVNRDADSKNAEDDEY